nr:Ycf20 protein [Pyropia sp. Myanmar_A]BED43274.1 Ycf20 protein [Pyropia sp. Myanmar_B]BED43471.1 Ycf20 protein [Pyropia sp. Myanmar_C]
MMKTRLSIFLTCLVENLNNKLYYSLKELTTGLISLLLGFFISTGLSTIPGQTGDWGIIAASLIVAATELTSKIVYSNQKKVAIRINLINNFKIGITYGLFVDAFKLGS